MWPNPQKTADLVTFTEDILNGKLHFLCSVIDLVTFTDEMLIEFQFVYIEGGIVKLTNGSK